MKPPLLPSLAVLLLSCLGCAKPAAEILHILTPPLLGIEYPDSKAAALKVEVMPIRLPDALKRPQLFEETTPGTLKLVESHRWANGLDRDLQRVMVDNLSRLLGSETVVAFPYGDRVQADYRLEIDVHRLVGSPGGQLSLQATWMLCPANKGPALLVKKATLEKPVAGATPQALVEAHGQALADLSRMIAMELTGLARAGK